LVPLASRKNPVDDRRLGNAGGRYARIVLSGSGGYKAAKK